MRKTQYKSLTFHVAPQQKEIKWKWKCEQKKISSCGYVNSAIHGKYHKHLPNWGFQQTGLTESEVTCSSVPIFFYKLFFIFLRAPYHTIRYPKYFYLYFNWCFRIRDVKRQAWKVSCQDWKFLPFSSFFFHSPHL